MREGTCERCGDSYTTNQPRQRFCSKSCQRKAERKRYRERHSETAACRGCGGPFQRSKVGGRLQVYCSLGCQYEHRSADYKARGIQPKVTSIGLGAYYRTLRVDPCAYCGGRAGEIDHIHPRSEGGANHWENYAAICATCNASKGAKSVLGFLGWRRAAREFDGWRRFSGLDADGDSRAAQARAATRG